MSVPHALLALLSEGPKYGLRLQSEFESRTGEAWPLNVGQVYTTLQRLERDGLVETDDAEQRALAEALPDHPDRQSSARRLASNAARPRPAAARRAGDQGAGGPPGSRDGRARDPAGASPPRDRGHAALHADQGGCGEDDIAIALVADAELFRLEAIVRWLDAADVRLKQRPPAAPVAPAAAEEQSPDPTPAMEVSP